MAMQTTTRPHMNPNHPAMPPYHPPPLSYCSNVPAIMSTAPPTSRRTAPAFAGPRHPDGGSSRAVSVTLFICELLVLPERHVIVPDGLAAAQQRTRRPHKTTHHYARWRDRSVQRPHMQSGGSSCSTPSDGASRPRTSADVRLLRCRVYRGWLVRGHSPHTASSDQKYTFTAI